MCYRCLKSSAPDATTTFQQAAKSALAILRVRSLSQAKVSCPTQPPLPRAVASYASPASAEKPSASSDGSGAVSTVGAADSNGSNAKKAANGSSRRSSVFEMYLRLRDLLSCNELDSEPPMNLRAIAGVPVGGGEGARGAIKMCNNVGNDVGVGVDDSGRRTSNRPGASGSPAVPVDPSRTARRPKTGDDLAATEKERLALSLPSLLLLPPPPAQSQPPVGLGSWISGSSRSPEASAVSPIPARSLNLEASVFAALEELRNGIRIAGDPQASSAQAKTSGKAANDATVAPYSIEKCGEPYSVSASGSYSSSSSAAGRSAAAAVAARGGDFPCSSVLSQPGMDVMCVTGSGADKRTRDDNRTAKEERRVGGFGKLSEVDMLSALAPLLEEIVGRQRREWDMQVSASGI